MIYAIKIGSSLPISWFLAVSINRKRNSSSFVQDISEVLLKKVSSSKDTISNFKMSLTLQAKKFRLSMTSNSTFGAKMVSKTYAYNKNWV